METLDKLQQEGINAFKSGDYELAEEKFEKMVEIATQEDNQQKLAEAFNDLGVIRQQLDNTDGAFEVLNKALTYYQDIDDERGEAITLGNLGKTEEAAGKYEDAVQSYIDAATIFEELGESEMAMYSWQALSRLKLRQKEWIGAIAAYEEGISHLPDKSFKKKMLQKLLKMPTKFINT